MKLPLLSHPATTWLVACLVHLAPLAVIATIWLPILRHEYVPAPSVSANLLTRLRKEPADPLFDELNELTGELIPEMPLHSQRDIVDAADRILSGEIQLSSPGPTRITLPFDAVDLTKGSHSWQLSLASFAVPRLLVTAYRLTRRDDYLFLARDIIHAWALYDRSVWITDGYLRNDHAVAARIPVLATFWSLYRNHRAYDPAIATVILEFVGRSAYLLAAPDRFTFATNHGVMQNLALLHMALTFPAFPDVDVYKYLAVQRLENQMAFYVNSEGVVLEHSAGYHGFGLHLMSIIFRYLTLLELPIPRSWQDKYEKAAVFYANLRRPDNTLPAIGDTDLGPDSLGPLLTRVTAGRAASLRHETRWVPAATHALYPIAGYAILWNGLERWPTGQALSQTVVGWSHFPGHGHKHADEMSVLLWANGHTWWTNVGYWPYGLHGRIESEMWEGSNAPHVVGEPRPVKRGVSARGYAWSDKLAVLDLERVGHRAYTVRRQVLHLKPDVWIVLDHRMGEINGRLRTVWTTPQHIAKSSLSKGAYVIKAHRGTARLTTFVSGSPGTTLAVAYGQRQPFAGWMAVGGMPKETFALIVEQPPADSWALTVWALGDSQIHPPPLTGAPTMAHFQGPEDWSLSLSTAAAQITLTRVGRRVRVSGVATPIDVLLQEQPELATELDRLQQAHDVAARVYPKFRTLLTYRLRLTYLLTLGLVAQESWLFACRRIRGRGMAWVMTASLLGWAAIGVWLSLVYFQT